MAMGKYLDGRVSMVVGSHTHVPTNDARLLPKGTAYQTDAGMCGDYDSVIGFAPEAPLERFLSKIPKGETGRGERGRDALRPAGRNRRCDGTGEELPGDTMPKPL